MTLLVSWGTQPLRVSQCATLTPVAPLGLWGIWCMLRAINMPPLWG